MIIENQRNWHNVLLNALWVDQVTLTVALGNSSFFLVHGKEAILPPNIYITYLQFSQSTRVTMYSMLQRQINTLMKSKEERGNAWLKSHNHNLLVKRWSNKNYVGNKYLEVIDLVFKWDKLNEPKVRNMKLQHLWLGPFNSKNIGQGIYRLETL